MTRGVFEKGVGVPQFLVPAIPTDGAIAAISSAIRWPNGNVFTDRLRFTQDICRSTNDLEGHSKHLYSLGRPPQVTPQKNENCHTSAL